MGNVGTLMGGRLSGPYVESLAWAAAVGREGDGDPDAVQVRTLERGWVVSCADANTARDLAAALLEVVDLGSWQVMVEPYRSGRFTHRVVLFVERRREVRS